MKIRLATAKDILAVENLRKDAYQSATGSVIPDHSFLLWNEEDDHSLILVLEDESQQIIATMRGKVIHDHAELERFFDITIRSELKFPVFTMGRAATLMNYRRLGFSAVFRVLFLQACQGIQMEYVVATIQEDASRVSLLRQLGYTVEVADLSMRKNDDFQNISRAMVASLNREDFKSAEQVATQLLKTKMSAFEMSEHLLEEMQTAMQGSAALAARH